MNHCTKAQLIAFEDRIRAAWEAGELPFLLHLCGGNEEQIIEIFKEIQPGDWVFSGHRSHYHALLSGMGEGELEDKIRRGDSMFVFGNPKLHGPTDHHNYYECHACAREYLAKHPQARPEWEASKHQAPEVHFLTSSVLAGTCCIAAGVAWALKRQFAVTGTSGDGAAVDFERRSPHVWCFLGDGAEDEGHFYEAVNFVEGHNLPCNFIVEDNDRSVETNIAQRRGHDTYWGQPWTREIPWPACVRRYHYKPTYPHAGSGCKFNITFRPEVVAAQRAINATLERSASRKGDHASV